MRYHDYQSCEVQSTHSYVQWTKQQNSLRFICFVRTGVCCNPSVYLKDETEERAKVLNICGSVHHA